MTALDTLTGRAFVTSATRVINQGLIVISPIFLVHLLTVESFGRYREFLLYAGILCAIATLGIYNSLLYFIPGRPRQTRRFVFQSVILTAINSIVVVAVMLAVDAITGGRLVGGGAWLLALYVLLFVNLDFWEYLWLAERRVLAVFAYTSGRLLVRLIAVVAAAAFTADVTAMVVALIAVEGIRLLISATALPFRLRSSVQTEDTAENTWWEQLRFCMPVGAATLLSSGNRSIGGLLVAGMLGPVALAHYAIGTYVQPIVAVLRNSISDVLLPHMVGQRTDPARTAEHGESEKADELEIWRRSTVVFAMLLLPVGILLARYAETIVLTLFSEEYRPAIVIFQVYILVLLRDCFDFSVPLRVLGQNAPILYANVLALCLHVAALLLLLQKFGLIGAIWGFVASRFVEGIYLGHRMMRAWSIRLPELAGWGDLLKVFIAALVAAPVLLASAWTQWFGVAGGLVIGAVLFMIVYGGMLYILRLPEAAHALRWMRAAMPLRLQREIIR